MHPAFTSDNTSDEVQSPPSGSSPPELQMEDGDMSTSSIDSPVSPSSLDGSSSTSSSSLSTKVSTTPTFESMLYSDTIYVAHDRARIHDWVDAVHPDAVPSISTVAPAKYRIPTPAPDTPIITFATPVEYEGGSLSLPSRPPSPSQRHESAPLAMLYKRLNILVLNESLGAKQMALSEQGQRQQRLYSTGEGGNGRKKIFSIGTPGESTWARYCAAEEA